MHGNQYTHPMRLALLLLAAAALSAQPYRDRMGVEIDGPGDGSRSRPFVNHARLFRPCTVSGGSAAVPVDGDGWPTADATCVMFDVRPIPAWAPPIDDPRQFQPDWSGVWNLSLQGRADITAPSGGASVNSLRYNSATNTTTAQVAVAPGTGLLTLDFRNTNGGFRSLRLIRPGYAASSEQVFTDEFLRSFTPFRILRYMDWTNTNGNTPAADPTQLLSWSNRRLPTDATQQSTGSKTGAAWEFAVLLANQTGTDLWINIPVAASDDYIHQLARQFATRLNPSLRVSLEHGNEVWNPLFANSYNFNRNAALAEVAAGGSKLNADASTNTDTLSARYHLRRLTEAVKIFRQEMPEDSPNTRIRGVFAWWTIYPDRYLNALNWYKTNYGDPGAVLYGVAQTHYYDVSQASPNASPDTLITVMQQSSDSGLRVDQLLRPAAANLGLVQLIYEGGPDVGGGSTVNVGNRIEANRLPAMKDLVTRDMKTNFFDAGGAEYMYFSHCGPCSRYGCWGATEDIVDLTSPKWTALAQLAGVLPEVALTPTPSIVNAASGSSAVAPGSFVTLRGDGFVSAGTWTWDQGMLDSSPSLPPMLAGVQVRVAGRDTAIHYASRSQLNAVLPPDVPAGPNPIEVFTRNGVYRGSLSVAALAPALFSYNLGNATYAAALIANTATFVAPEGSLPGVQARPAKPGDYVELYATGLGATAESYPANQQLSRPYPVADLSQVQVTIGGRSATVLYAALTGPGLYQVNIQVPAGVPAGDQPLQLSIAGVNDRISSLAIAN